MGFDTEHIGAMTEQWAVRGVEELVGHYEVCAALLNIQSLRPGVCADALSALQEPVSQDYFVALSGIVRLLAKPLDDLEALADFLYFQPKYEDCEFRVRLSHLTSDTHNYALFGQGSVNRWGQAVDAFDSVTLPAAKHVQWLTPTPPAEFQRPLA